MSGAAPELRALLADPARNGAYFVDARDADALAEAARGLGFAFERIDLAGVRDQAGLLARLSEALGFPDWFGGNWDALADCLADLSWRPADGYVLLFADAAALRQAAPALMAALVDVLDDSARRWAAGRVPFWALLPLPTDELAQLPG